MRKHNLKVALMILGNKKLSDYKQQLQMIRKRGYKLGGLMNFTHHRTDEPYIILRHDVDIKSVGIKEMLAAEEELGVISSWYFRWLTADKKIIHRIHNSGGEVGLHYETLATICNQCGIQSRKLITSDIIARAHHVLTEEIKQFRRKYDVPCRMVASHGSPTNRKIRTANNEIVNKEFYHWANIDVEAYDQELLDGTNVYISDTTPIINYRWAYRMSFSEAIDTGYYVIYFLSHPNHWLYHMRDKVQLLNKLITRGVHVSNRTFRATFS